MIEDVKDLRPMHHDLIIKYHDINEMTGSSIIIEDKSKDVTTHYCKVVRISPNVTDVKEGDIIVVSWLNMTDPFLVMIDGKEEKVVITSEEKVLGVVEE